MNKKNITVTHLGTAAAEGWPGLFCNCPSCKAAQITGGKNLRLRSSVLINNELMCDISPDFASVKMRLGLDTQKLKSILITHTHLDHFATQMLNYNYTSFSVSPVKLNIYCSEYAKQMLLSQNYENPAALQNITITPLAPYTPTPIAGGYTVTALEAQHSAPQSLLYLIQKDGMTLFYCNDTYILPQQTMEYLKKVRLDYASFDATMGLRREGYKRHLSFYDIIDLTKQLVQQGSADSKTLFTATHFSHFIGMSHEEITEFFRPYGITAAYDGMQTTISTL